MNTEKIPSEINRNSFCQSKSGRFICGLESLVLYALIAVAICYLFQTIDRGASILDGTTSSFPEVANWLLITMAIFGGLVGFISGYRMYFSFFVWRFFKPDEKHIRIYVQSEINRLEENMSSNIKDLLRKKAELASEVENVEKINAELFEKTSKLQALICNY